MNCFELTVAVSSNDYLPYWKHENGNARQWTGFYGELLAAIQDVTNLTMKIVYKDFNNSWDKIGSP